MHFSFALSERCFPPFCFQLKVTRSDSNQLTAEERQNLVTVTAQQSDLLFHDSSISHLENEATEERNLTVQVLNYTVPEDGIIDIEFPVLPDTKTLRVQVLLQSSNTASLAAVVSDRLLLPSIATEMPPTIVFLTSYSG